MIGRQLIEILMQESDRQTRNILNREMERERAYTTTLQQQVELNGQLVKSVDNGNIVPFVPDGSIGIFLRSSLTNSESNNCRFCDNQKQLIN